MLFIILALIAGAVAGALVAWLILRERLTARQSDLDTTKSKLAQNDVTITSLQEEGASLRTQLATIQVQASEQ